MFFDVKIVSWLFNETFDCVTSLVGGIVVDKRSPVDVECVTWTFLSVISPLRSFEVC